MLGNGHGIIAERGVTHEGHVMHADSLSALTFFPVPKGIADAHIPNAQWHELTFVNKSIRMTAEILTKGG